MSENLKQMKICYIGDAERIHMQKFAKWFADQGHEVHLIHLVPFRYDDIPLGDADFKNVKLHLLKKLRSPLRKIPPSNLLYYVVQVKQLIKKINPDILHVHYVTYHGLIGALTGFHPFIITPWGSDILVNPDKSPIEKFFTKYVLKKADAVSVMNNGIKRKLAELKCSRDKIVPLRIASVDTNEFSPSNRSKSLRKSISDENDFLVMDTRQSVPIYRLDVFIQAIPFVLKEISNVKFIVILRPCFEPANRKIKELIGKLNVENDVICIETIHHSKMPDYLASVDLYVDSIVSASAMMDESFIDETSGIGTTTLEAMSCGTPVLIANKNKMDKYPYRTFYPLNHQDLADKIVDLLKNEELRNKLKKQAREFAIRTGDKTVQMKKWERFYIDL